MTAVQPMRSSSNPSSRRMATVAAVADLRVRRGRRDILHGVSLALEAGTTTLLVGLNGAGKTTLLQAFYGGIDRIGGTVSVGGLDPRHDRLARSRIGLVPQEIALYPRLTVSENIEVFAALSGQSERAAVAPILARVGLSGAARQLVSALSGGMQRRANLACALVGRPSLLLLDEPTVGLDLAARQGFAADLRRLAGDTGAAILLTTHDLDESEALADRVAVLHAGHLIAEGSPAALIGGVYGPADRRLDLLLGAAATVAEEAALRGRGFLPIADGRVWRGYVAIGAAGVPSPADLGFAEATVRELRLRRPGLEDAFSALIGKAHGT